MPSQTAHRVALPDLRLSEQLGNAEDPYATLAWVANHLAERGRDLKAGMVVITGSVIPTVSIASGDRALFTVDGLGEVAMEVF